MLKTNKSKILLYVQKLEKDGNLNYNSVESLNNNLKANGYDFTVRFIQHPYPYSCHFYEIDNIADYAISTEKLQLGEAAKSSERNRMVLIIFKPRKINKENVKIALKEASKAIACAAVAVISFFSSSSQVKAKNFLPEPVAVKEQINKSSNSINEVVLVKRADGGSSGTGKSTGSGSTGVPGTDAFTPSFPKRTEKPATSLFGTPNPENPSGGGNAGGDTNPNQPEECSEVKKLPYGSQPWEWSPSLDSDTESTDSDSNSDSDLEEEFVIKKLTVIAVDGTRVVLSADQFRDKGYHITVFPHIKIPKTFDLAHLQKLPYNNRLAYLRDRSKLPETVVHKLMHEVSKVLRSSTTKAHSGCLGKTKIPGKVYVNLRSRIVVFVNDSNSEVRTYVRMSAQQLDRLKLRGYHLFPNV